MEAEIHSNSLMYQFGLASKKKKKPSVRTQKVPIQFGPQKNKLLNNLLLVSVSRRKKTLKYS